MIIKWLCKRYGLIKKDDLRDIFALRAISLQSKKEMYKQAFDNNTIAEWSYYKHFWRIKGRLAMMKDIAEILDKE